MLKKSLLLLALLSFYSLNVKANALEEIYTGEKIDNVYIRKIDEHGNEKTKQGIFIRRKSDNVAVYCLEPFISLINDSKYEIVKNNYLEKLNISNEIWNKINLIAYYGYQYNNHKEDYWYYITQVLIWREIDKNARFYFTDGLNGNNNENIFANEIAEIYKLVENHNKKPNLGNIELTYGETKKFDDTNNVLNNYVIENNESVKIENNKLIITGNIIGENKITLRKEDNLYNEYPILYFDSESQKVLAAGSYFDEEIDITFNVIETNLKIIKKDNNTKKPIAIANIKFDIYKEDGSFVIEVATDNNGEIKINCLPVGNYVLKEKDNQIISDYEINKDSVTFSLKDTKEVIIDFYNEPKKGKIEVIKISEDNKLLENIKFGIYNENNELLDIKYTNEFGKIIFDNLLEGKYIIKEFNDNDNFLNNDEEYIVDLKVDDKTNDIETITLNIVNYYKKGKLVIKKVDEKGNPIAETEFVLLDNNLNEIYRRKTNEEGIIEIENLLLGNYILKETKASLGYQVMDKEIPFEIKNDKDIINIKVTNEKIKVKIPNTNISITRYDYILPQKKKLKHFK